MVVVKEMGVTMDMILLLKTLFSEQVAIVMTDQGNTDEFLIRSGVRQGCILSPIPYNINAEIVIHTNCIQRLAVRYRRSTDDKFTQMTRPGPPERDF